jgi:glycerophosphoryl diester phosphodiesterase
MPNPRFRSADGGHAVIHDASLDRTTDGTGPVAALTMAELGRLSAGIRFDAFFRNERIMPLSAFLEAAGAEGQLYVEIKDADPATTLAEVERAGILSRVFFWSADATLLLALRALSGEARIMVERDKFATIREAVEAIRPAIVQFDLVHDDLGAIDACRQAGIAAMVKYFGADPAVFERIIRLKPDMINLDRADIFVAAYAKVALKRT